MDSKQRPNAFTDFAATRSFLLTTSGVFELCLHFLAVQRIAIWRLAPGRMFDDLDVKVYIPLPFAALCFGETIGVSFLALTIFNRNTL